MFYFKPSFFFSAENPCSHHQSSGRKHRQRNFIISCIAPDVYRISPSPSFSICSQSVLLLNCNHVLLAFETVTLASRLWDVMRLITEAEFLETRVRTNTCLGRGATIWQGLGGCWYLDSLYCWNTTYVHRTTKTEDLAPCSGQATPFLLSLLASIK